MRASGLFVCLIALLPTLCQAEKIDYSRAAKAKFLSPRKTGISVHSPI